MRSIIRWSLMVVGIVLYLYATGYILCNSREVSAI